MDRCVGRWQGTRVDLIKLCDFPAQWIIGEIIRAAKDRDKECVIWLSARQINLLNNMNILLLRSKLYANDPKRHTEK